MNSLETINFLIENFDPPLVTRPAPQVGNYCYLIAGLEMLVSCKTFLRLVAFQTERDKWRDLSRYESSSKQNADELWKLMPRYISDPTSCYEAMDEAIRKSLGIVSRADKEDINVVFLAFSKSYYFNKLFSYGTWMNTNKPFTINFERYNGQLTTRQILEVLKTSDIYSFAVFADEHWEVFQKVIVSGKYKYYAQNTQMLLPRVPEAVVLLIHSDCQYKFKTLF